MGTEATQSTASADPEAPTLWASASQAVGAFLGYKYVSLPDLSNVRNPPNLTELVSVHVASECEDRHVLVALARCLGAYCAATDLILGWQQDGRMRAARVSWDAAATWKDVFDKLVLRDIGQNDLCKALELDTGQNPFLAVVSDDTSLEHPLVATLHGGQLSLKVSTRYFHASAASIVLKQIAEIVNQLITQPAGRPSTLAFLPHDLQSRTEQCTSPAYTHIEPIDFVVELVSRRPSSQASDVAIEYYSDLYRSEDVPEPERMTYGELDARSNQLARYLAAEGLPQEGRVAVCLPRNLAFHVFLMGILKAGGCYVPVEPELPEERRAFISQDSGAFLTLTETNIDDHMRRAEEYSTKSINLATREGLAYLLYTSGTTGTPKGCLLTHEGFAECLLPLSSLAHQAWSDEGRYLAVASIAFDVHLAEMFVAFALGIPSICAPRSQLLEDLPTWLRKLRITHVGVVPSLIEATMCAVEDTADGEEGMRLTYLSSGGEKMTDAILERWADHRQVRLANFYGPSEVTIGCSARFMSSNTRGQNVGRIFKTCSAYVVDERLEVVPRGGMGELLVGGPLVARGYHQRDDLTKKAFVELDGERVYRTGDLVRMMPDDTLEILGRSDTQIKLRGVRIESEGISSVIRKAAIAHLGNAASVDVSTVLTRHPLLQSDQLVSFIAWDKSASIALRRSSKPAVLPAAPQGLMTAIRGICDRELASYMRPAHVVPVQFMPLNSNGKTDNKVLVAVFQAASLEEVGSATTGEAGRQPETTGHPSRPLTETEAQLADLIAGFTKLVVDQLHPSSNLFELGFDSLKLVKLASQIRSKFSLSASSMPVGDLMRYPMVEDLAALVVRRKEVHESSTSAAQSSYVRSFGQEWRLEVEASVRADIIEDVLPTFPVQDGVLYRSADCETLYVQHVILRCVGDISTERLIQAWKAAVDRHEILRTVFFFSRSIAQIVLKSNTCELPWQAWRMAAPMQSAEFTSWFLSLQSQGIAAEINRAISSKPPFRLVLYTSESVNYLTLSIHHSIYDGVSLPLLLKDVDAIYCGRELQPTASLSMILENIHTTNVADAVPFFKRLFEGYEWSGKSLSPASGEVAQVQTFRFRSSASVWEKRAASVKVTLQALFTASFGICLGRHVYNRRDVAFGVIRSGRSFGDDAIDNAMCPLLSLLPTRFNGSTLENVLKLQDHIAAMVAFEHVPLSVLQQGLNSGGSLFDVLFSMSHKSEDSFSLWEVTASVQPEADYTLAIELVIDPTSSGITATSAYTLQIPQHVIASLLADLEIVAKGLVDGQAYRDIDINGWGGIDQAPALSLKDDFGAVEDTESIDSEREEKCRRLIADFLKIDADLISPTSSLISFGMDSIKSIACSRLLRREGVLVTALDVMRYSSIRQLAMRGSKTPNAGPSAQATEGENMLARDREGINQALHPSGVRLNDEDEVELYPATVLQSGMLSQTVNSGGRLYLHAFAFKLSNTLDCDRLKIAWKKALLMISILRTSFHFHAELGCWIQAIHSEPDFKWNDVQSAARRSVAESVQFALDFVDLTTETAFSRPPVYFHLFQDSMAESENSGRLLVLVIHHALYDAITMTRLSDVVKAIYRGEQSPDVGRRFADLLGYFLVQEKYGTQYWVKRLETFTPSIVPRSLTSRKNMGSSSPVVSLKIPLSSSRLNEVSRLCSVTPQCFGQAAWARLLSKLCNTRDVTFGHVLSGRNVPHAEDVLGPMITTVPCRVTLASGVPDLQVLQEIQRSNVAALEWQHASLRSIQRELGVKSIWDSIFLFQSFPSYGELSNDLDPWSFVDLDADDARLQYALNIELHEAEEFLIAKAACQPDVMALEDLQQLMERFSDLLLKIVENRCDGSELEEPSEDPFNSQKAEHEATSATMGRSGALEMIKLHPEASSVLEVIATSIKAPASSIISDTPLVSLGLDSITSIQIAARLRKIGFRISSATVLQSYALSDLLCDIFDKTDPGPAATSGGTLARPLASSSIDAVHRVSHHLGVDAKLIESVVPPSAGMKWLIGMLLVSNRTRFQHAFAFRLPPQSSDPEKLRQAWVSLVERHAILRSTFTTTTERDVYLVTFKELPADRLWSTHSISDDIDNESLLRQFLQVLVAAPPTTDRPPTKAIFLLCNSAAYFILHLHHFQYDAWSLHLLIDDLDRLCRGDDAISSNNLLEFIEDSRATDARANQQKSYWQGYIPSATKFSLLPSRVTTGRGRRRFLIDRSALQDEGRLRKKAIDLSIPLNSVFLACWARVQAVFCRTQHATFGLWHLGRSGSMEALTTLAVPCMNVLPIYIQDVHIPLSSLSMEVHSQLRRRTHLVEQSDLEDIDVWVGGAGKPITNIYVNIVATPGSKKHDGFTGFQLADVPYSMPQSDQGGLLPQCEKPPICDLLEDALMVDIFTAGNTVGISMEYQDDVLDDDQARLLISSWKSLVNEVLEISDR